MVSSSSPVHDPAELGELERSVLAIVWQFGTATAERVREKLGRPLKESTVRTVLSRLEEKGYLRHSVDSRTFVYSPAETRQHVGVRAVRRIVDWFYEGSMEDLVVGMVESRELGQDELDRLAARIAEARKAIGGNASPKKDREAQS